MSFYRHIFDDAIGAAGACAAFIAAALRQQLAANPLATLAVSGGSTSRLMFDALVNESLEWPRTHVFFVDERPVPPGHPESNYSLCETHLLTPAAVPAANVHRILAERGPTSAASLYAAEITAFHRKSTAENSVFHREFTAETPHFTVLQCGIGPDCHTASLFPGEPLIDDREGLVAAVEVAKLHQARITMLPRILLNAKNLVVLVCGQEKAWALDKAFHAPLEALQYPAQLFVHQRDSEFFLDRAAASLD